MPAPAILPAHIRSTVWAGDGNWPYWRHHWPCLGGALHAAQLPLQASFLAFALPGLVGAAAIMGFLWHGRVRSAR